MTTGFLWFGERLAACASLHRQVRDGFGGFWVNLTAAGQIVATSQVVLRYPYYSIPDLFLSLSLLSQNKRAKGVSLMLVCHVISFSFITMMVEQVTS